MYINSYNRTYEQSKLHNQLTMHLPAPHEALKLANISNIGKKMKDFDRKLMSATYVHVFHQRNYVFEQALKNE